MMKLTASKGGREAAGLVLAAKTASDAMIAAVQAIVSIINSCISPIRMVWVPRLTRITHGRLPKRRGSLRGGFAPGRRRCGW